MKVVFGVFELDLETAELRKHRVRLQLQEQPFSILQILLERRGEVVSREELITRLWGDSTHVDFERGLNAAVARLRQTLSDSAENPKYIETIPKRGYRFIVAEERAQEELGTIQTAAPPLLPRWPKTWIAASVGVFAIFAALRFRDADFRRIENHRPPFH
jgi:DNA-binding winged helix-turn-helix (wHTH) protein